MRFKKIVVIELVHLIFISFCSFLFIYLSNKHYELVGNQSYFTNDHYIDLKPTHYCPLYPDELGKYIYFVGAIFRVN